jgi:hypothetical protein
MCRVLIIPANRKNAWGCLFLVLLVILGTGCGRKRPPVPPSRQAPPAVEDLRAVVEGDEVRLTWTIPEMTRKARSAVSGVAVYRSKVPLTQPYCPACPILFERADEVSLKRFSGLKAVDKQFYIEKIEKGFQYTYKINVYDRYGAEGEDSNRVTFSH